MIYVLKRLDSGIIALQNFFEAELMESAEPHALSALARRFQQAMLHLAGGFVCECQPEDIFAGEIGIRLQQVADALGDHPCLACPRARDDQQRPFAMLDGHSLRGVERESMNGNSWPRGFLRIVLPRHWNYPISAL